MMTLRLFASFLRSLSLKWSNLIKIKIINFKTNDWHLQIDTNANYKKKMNKIQSVQRMTGRRGNQRARERVREKLMIDLRMFVSCSTGKEYREQNDESNGHKMQKCKKRKEKYERATKLHSQFSLSSIKRQSVFPSLCSSFPKSLALYSVARMANLRIS